MKLKTMMTIKAIVCLAFGIPILFFPKFLYGLFGIDLTGAATFPAQQYGASLIGNLLLTWIGRNLDDWLACRAIGWALFIYDLIGFVLTLILGLSGQANGLIWGVVAMYLLLAIGFGYFLIKPCKP